MTDGQLDLLGFGAPEAYFRPTPPAGKAPAKAHQLFLALRPQRGDISRLSLGAEPLKQRLGSATAKAVSPDLFHITLLDIDHFAAVYPQVRLDAIKAACSRVTCPTTIPVLHNRAMSFPSSGAFVLLCSAETEKAIRHLRTALSAELKAIGVGSKASSTPHLTTFYDKHLMAAETPLEPLAWQAVDFSLVISHKGLGYHQVLHSWPLGR